jgi:hypothetical protein
MDHITEGGKRLVSSKKKVTIWNDSCENSDTISPSKTQSAIHSERTMRSPFPDQRLSKIGVLTAMLFSIGLRSITGATQADHDSELASPVLKKVASWPLHPRGPALDVALHDQYAYVAIGSGGVLILDVSDPSMPQRLGNVDGVGYASLLRVHNDRLYVASRFHRDSRYGKEGYRGQLLVLDLRNPAQPALMGSQTLGTEIQSLDFEGDRMLIGEGNHAWGHTEASLRLLDVSDASELKTLDVFQLRNNGANHLFSSPGMVAVEQDRAYVSGIQANYGSLLISQLSDSGKFAPLATFVPNENSLWPVHHVQIQDGHLYISGRSMKDKVNTMQIWNMNQADSPTLAGTTDTFNSYFTLNDFPEMEIKDGHAILCSKQFGIQVIDVHDKTQPKVMDHFDTPGTALKAEVQDDVIFIADFEGGLQILKLNEAGKLQLIGHFDTGLTPSKFHLEGQRGYLLNQNKEPFLSNRPSYRWFIPGYIEYLDLSDPAHPALLGKIELPHYVDFLTATETRLFAGRIEEDIAKVVVYDVTDPKSPQSITEWVLSKEGHASHFVELTATDDPPRLYVSDKTTHPINNARINYTRIFDTSDPSNLTLLDEIPRGGAVAEGMKLHRNLLIQNVFVSDSLDKLVLIDSISPTEFEFIFSYQLPSMDRTQTGRITGGLAVDGTIVYAGLSRNGFAITDIRVPSQPKLLYHQTNTDEVVDLELSQDKLFVAEDWNGLSVYDVSNPLSPIIISNHPSNGPITDIELGKDHAFLLTHSEGLNIFELVPESLNIAKHPISPHIAKGDMVTLNVGANGSSSLSYQWYQGASADKSHPIPDANRSSFTTPSVDRTAQYWVQVMNGNKEIASDTVTINPIPPVKIELIGRWPDTSGLLSRQGFAYDLDISNDLIYLADGVDGIQVIQMTSPESPKKMAHVPVRANQLNIQGNHLFLGSDTFRVFSLANPYVPEEILKSKYDTSALFPMKSWGFIGTSIGFLSVDLSNPMREPSILMSNLISPVSEWQVSDIEVANQVAAISQNWGGIQFLDITNPAEPSWLSAFYPGASVKQLDWNGSTLVATHGELFPGIEVVDMSDPLHPRQTASIDLEASEDVALMDGSYALVTGKGLQAFDYGDPTQLVKVGSSDLEDVDTYGLVVEGDLAYVAAGEDGLLVFRITPQIKLDPPILENDTFALSWLGGPGIILQSKSPDPLSEWRDVPGTVGLNNWQANINNQNTWFRLIKR